MEGLVEDIGSEQCTSNERISRKSEMDNQCSIIYNDGTLHTMVPNTYLLQ